MKVLGSVLVSIALAATGQALAQTGCAPVSGPTGSTASVGSGIVVTNLRQNEVVGYELLLIKGTLAASADRVFLDHGIFPGETAYAAPVLTEADGMPKAVREWPAGAGRFKAMVHLKRGPNRIFLSAPGHSLACIDINYSPNPAPNRVRMIFVLAQDALERGRG
jgi:hypothetical protein